MLSLNPHELIYALFRLIILSVYLDKMAVLWYSTGTLRLFLTAISLPYVGRKNGVIFFLFYALKWSDGVNNER